MVARKELDDGFLPALCLGPQNSFFNGMFKSVHFSTFWLNLCAQCQHF